MTTQDMYRKRSPDDTPVKREATMSLKLSPTPSTGASATASASAFEPSESEEYTPTKRHKTNGGNSRSKGVRGGGRGATTPRKSRVKGGTSAPRRRPKQTKAAASNGASATGAAAGAWTGDEDYRLFTALHPKLDKPDWGAVAASVGGSRDAKSCQNRYYVWKNKGHLERAIKNLGSI